MGFQLKKVSEHGTSNPVVTRLTLQSHDLLGFCTMPKERKEDLLVLYHDQVMPRLLTCDTIARRVVKDIEAAVSTAKKRGMVTQAQGRVVEVPHVADLEQAVEQYLYSAKSTLRDAAGAFKIFFGEEFKEARYDKVLAWAQQRFGKENKFVHVLNEDHDQWIRRLVTMRNAVEHPGGHSGTLHIRNFEFSNNRLSTPVWHLNDEPPAGVAHEMPMFVQNMLTFCEDLLVFGMQAVGMIPGVGIVEIPEAERVPDLPKRLKAAFLGPQKSRDLDSD